MVKDPLVH